jgi:hypothetical protein
MNTERIRDISNLIIDLKSIRFTHTNWQNVVFESESGFGDSKKNKSLSFAVVSHYDGGAEIVARVCKELEDAIRPVIEKRIKELKEELAAEIAP